MLIFIYAPIHVVVCTWIILTQIKLLAILMQTADRALNIV